MDRTAAEALDRADPLAGFRDDFLIADDGLVYLDGNSLGRLPRRTAERLKVVVADEWGAGLVRSWSEWIDLPGQVGDDELVPEAGERIGGVQRLRVGAVHAPIVASGGSVVPCASTTWS